jgi:hypothetical protein
VGVGVFIVVMREGVRNKKKSFGVVLGVLVFFKIYVDLFI